jgi:hypothetical protein
MIKFTAGGGGLGFSVTASGLAIYLDNFSLIRLAKEDPSRRLRFLNALHRGGDLLFSVANAADIVGPQGRSLEKAKEFLNKIGPRWFPVELDPLVVVRRELAGSAVADSCVSKQFLKDYSAYRMGQQAGPLVDLSEQFFSLGAVIDWWYPQRESIRRGLVSLDGALIRRIDEYRAEFERDPQWLDQRFPALSFNPSHPATFTYVSLVRSLVLEAKAYKLKKGDGLDFCHAVMAAAFASVATLDKHWKRRIESLPTPNKLARIYYGLELDEMVDHIEAWVDRAAPVEVLS